jgi:peptidoglycan/LPS O-acetylase OafA/YrhL
MRNHQLDLLRATAIVFVLLIHNSLTYESTPSDLFIGGWFSMIARPTIAMFLFASGYFFQETVTLPYLWSRYQRVFIPYLVFSLLALLYQQKIIYAPAYLVNNWPTVLENLLIGNSWGVYWFIPLIIFVYTLAFLTLRYGAGVGLGSITLIYLIINLLHAGYYTPLVEFFGLEESKFIWYYSYRFFISWPFFFFAGMTLRKHQGVQLLLKHRRLVVAVWLGIFLLANLLYFTIDSSIDMYNSVIGTVYAGATIGLVLSFDIESTVITFISKVSYLIYLAHYFFIAALKAAEKSLGAPWPFWFWVISFMVSLVGPLLLYWIAKKFLKEKSGLIIGA